MDGRGCPQATAPTTQLCIAVQNKLECTIFFRTLKLVRKELDIRKNLKNAEAGDTEVNRE